MKKQIFLVAAVLGAMPTAAQQQPPTPTSGDYGQAAAILAGSTPAAPPAAVHTKRKAKPEISGTIQRRSDAARA